MRTVFVPLILAGLVLASCSNFPSPGTAGRDAKAHASTSVTGHVPQLFSRQTLQTRG